MAAEAFAELVAILGVVWMFLFASMAGFGRPEAVNFLKDPGSKELNGKAQADRAPGFHWDQDVFLVFWQPSRATKSFNLSFDLWEKRIPSSRVVKNMKTSKENIDCQWRTLTTTNPLSEVGSEKQWENISETIWQNKIGVFVLKKKPIAAFLCSLCTCVQGYVRFGLHEEAVGLLAAFAEDDEEGPNCQGEPKRWGSGRCHMRLENA